jgi:predicted nucleotidyltransferase
VLSQEHISQMVALLDERCGLDALYVYGSEASGELRPDSDLDIAILARRPPAGLEHLALQTELTALLGREVDLIILDEVSPILAMQVLRKGHRLVSNDPTRAGEVEARLFSQYADLKRVRASAEQALMERVRGG